MDLRAHILGLKDSRLPGLIVTVPEWEVDVGLRRLTLSERLAFEKANGAFDDINRNDDGDAYNVWLVRYVIATACTPGGDSLFHPEDESALLDKSGTAIERLVLAALKINVMAKEDVESLGKSSGGAPNGASPSVSPVTSG